MPEMPPFTVSYNIQEEFDDYPQLTEYFRSVPELPPLDEFAGECAEIFELLRQVISEYLSDEGFPEYGDVLEKIFGEYAVGEFPNDRTMYFFLGAVNAFTPTFVRRLQETVLARFPLWRIMAQYESCQLGIYPQGVWLGKVWIDGDFDEDLPAYRDWIAAATNEQESKYGPLRRQLSIIRQLIPNALERMQRQRFCVVEAFDRYQPHFPGAAIWILVAGTDGDISLDVDMSPIRSSAISETGTVYPPFWPEFWPYTDRKPPFTLLTYVVDRALGVSFEMKDSVGTRVGSFTVERLANDRVPGHDS